MMTRPPFTHASSAAESLNLTRIEILDLARVGKLVAWVQPETIQPMPFIVRAGKLQPTADGTGRKLAMPDGQFLVFERDALVNLKGNGWLDLSVLTEQNHALLRFAYRGQDGEPVELMPGVLLGDGAGNFYEVAAEGPRTMAMVGFMTQDLEALRAAHDAEPAVAEPTKPERQPAPYTANKQTTREDMDAPKVHTTKGRRRDTLTPVIEHAQRLCNKPWDVAEVWIQLHSMTAQKYTVLLHLDGDAVVYTDGDNTKKITKKMLGDRLRGMRERLANAA